MAASSSQQSEAIRMDFARRLQNALNEKGWTQSELARRVAPHLKESRIGRDNISKYVRGRVLPLPPALEAIAKALDMKSSELLPARAVAADSLPIHIRIDGDGDTGWIHLNAELPVDAILEIRKIYQKHQKPSSEQE